jgi:ElaA protein
VHNHARPLTTSAERQSHHGTAGPTTSPTATLYELHKPQVDISVVEQAIRYSAPDRRDLLAETRHFWLEGSAGAMISTFRRIEEHAGVVKVFTIGPGCTKKSARGVQTYLEEIYGRHGFIRDGAEFLDDSARRSGRGGQFDGGMAGGDRT